MLLATSFWETFFLILIFLPLALVWGFALLDIFRRDDIGGGSKALWVAAVILLPFLGTRDAARDLEVLRGALGDKRLNYLGKSYGTYLGAVYATMFPDRVRAMVLDSAFEPSGDTIEQQYLTQLQGFEGAFDNWASWCAGEPTCPFAADDVGSANKFLGHQFI